MDLTFEKLLTYKESLLSKVLATKDILLIKQFLDEWGLQIYDNKIRPMKEYIGLWNDLFSYFDKKQLVKKISLNSAFFKQCLH